MQEINTIMLMGMLLAAALSQADMPMENPEEEKRAMALMYEIRCVACENEPISHSASEIARDMRQAIRKQIRQGYSNKQIRQWFARRYGEFVLFRPPMHGLAAGVWILPFLLFGLGLAGVVIYFRRPLK